MLPMEGIGVMGWLGLQGLGLGSEGSRESGLVSGEVEFTSWADRGEMYWTNCKSCFWSMSACCLFRFTLHSLIILAQSDEYIMLIMCKALHIYPYNHPNLCTNILLHNPN